MIYNLYEFVKAGVTDVTFIVDGWEVGSPEISVLMSQTGGESDHWYPRTDYTVQFISRAANKVECRQNIYKVYTLLKNRFGCELPEAIVGGETFPAVIAAQISPIQEPGYIGVDSNKNHLYSFNSIVTVGG